MIKVVNKDFRTTSLTSFCCPHCQLWTYFTLYSNVYNVDFWKDKLCLKLVLWHSINTQAKRGHHSIVVIVKFKFITPSSSVSIVDFEYVFIFLVWSYISIAFRLRWIVQGECPGGKIQGASALGEFHGGNSPGGNYSGVIVGGQKSER